MIASKDKDIEEAARALFQFCTDEQVRKLCRDRDEYYQDLANYERMIAIKDAEIAEKNNVIATRDNTIAQKEELIKELSAKLEKQKADAF